MLVALLHLFGDSDDRVELVAQFLGQQACQPGAQLARFGPHKGR
jgi:hypothetical protein